MRFIGGKLARLREVLKLTQKEVEARTGVSGLG
jgi:transcriptional regulator with XRE-family HTH domain